MKKELIEKNKWLLIGFLTLGLTALGMTMVSNPRADAPAPQKPDSVDTMIPKGFILVPLELENIEQVSSLIGNSGVVDLYSSSRDTKKRKLVASRVKILQAPYNAGVYAALVRETEGHIIQNYLGPFRAVVQNPKQDGYRVSQEIRSNFKITYQK